MIIVLIVFILQKTKFKYVFVKSYIQLREL